MAQHCRLEHSRFSVGIISPSPGSWKLMNDVADFYFRIFLDVLFSEAFSLAWDVSTRKRWFCVRVFLLLDGLPSKIDEPHQL